MIALSNNLQVWPSSYDETSTDDPDPAKRIRCESTNPDILQEEPNHVEVTVPFEAEPGNTFYVRTPSGNILRSNFPQGVKEGQRLIVRYPRFPEKPTAVKQQPQQRKKKTRDPNAPKRASNAYMIFCKARRARLKSERPDLAFGKLGAKLGEMWRQMTPSQRRPYEDKAAIDRHRFKLEMKRYSSRIKRTNKAKPQNHAQSGPPHRNKNTAMAESASHAASEYTTRRHRTRSRPASRFSPDTSSSSATPSPPTATAARRSGLGLSSFHYFGGERVD